MISKDLFCKAMKMLLEQDKIDNEFSNILQKYGNGFLPFGADNKCREALLLVLKEGINDQYNYIDWWLYEGAPDYEIWSADQSKKWVLKDLGDLYDYIVSGE